ncbi:hypothetical protein GJ496_005978 [Pomphorhynchus laevis]|nr:hypothetical protein GJ496_005978 [Pomphorhynchus laevis]
MKVRRCNHGIGSTRITHPPEIDDRHKVASKCIYQTTVAFAKFIVPCVLIDKIDSNSVGNYLIVARTQVKLFNTTEIEDE